MKIEGLINGIDDEDSNIKSEGLDGNSQKSKVAVHNIEFFGSNEKVEAGNISRLERTVSVNDNSAAEETIRENLVREDGGYHCKICNFSRKMKIDVARHIETHIEGLSYSWSDCQKTFRSKDSLRRHKSKFHEF